MKQALAKLELLKVEFEQASAPPPAAPAVAGTPAATSTPCV